MTNPCSPNTSEPKTGIGSILVYDAAKLAEFLLMEGMGWLSPLVPQIGGQSYNLTDYCASDPPDPPSTDPTYILNLFNPLNGQAVVEQRDWLVALVNNFIWYSSCQCSAGAQPTPPSPISQPTDVNFTPPSSTPSGNCFTGSASHTPNYSNHVSWNFSDALPPGTGFSDGEFNRPPVPSPLPSSFVFTADVGTDGGNPTDITFTLNFYNAGQSSITASSFSANVTKGTTNYQSPTITIPSNAVYWGLIGTTLNNTDGNVTNTVSVTTTIYCQGQGPNSLGMVCCPTDPNLLAMVQQVLDTLTYIETLIPARVPNYAAGTAHSGLSGGSSLTLATTTIALKVVFDSLPTVYGEISGTPNTYLDLGWITPTNNEGPGAGMRVTRQTQTIPLPEASSGIDYTFPSGASVTITELQAG